VIELRLASPGAWGEFKGGLRLDRFGARSHHGEMGAMKHITADVPEDLLREAMAVTNQGVSETLIAGLELVRRTRAYPKALALRGKLDLDIDLGSVA
jgi:hypothetical protein